MYGGQEGEVEQNGFCKALPLDWIGPTEGLRFSATLVFGARPLDDDELFVANRSFSLPPQPRLVKIQIDD